MAHDNCISFKTERFDYSSELPAEYNAGNRFYGKDVAAYLCEQLAAAGLQADYLDEDWGWLVLGESAPSTFFEIAIYNVSEGGEGGRPGAPEWGLWVRAFQRGKKWGFIPSRTAIPISEAVLTAVRGAIKALGSEPEDWRDGPCS